MRSSITIDYAANGDEKLPEVQGGTLTTYWRIPSNQLWFFHNTLRFGVDVIVPTLEETNPLRWRMKTIESQILVINPAFRNEITENHHVVPILRQHELPFQNEPQLVVHILCRHVLIRNTDFEHPSPPLSGWERISRSASYVTTRMKFCTGLWYMDSSSSPAHDEKTTRRDSSVISHLDDAVKRYVSDTVLV